MLNRAERFRHRITRRRFLRFGLTLAGSLTILVSAAVFLFNILQPAHADIDQNNNTGRMTISFDGLNPWAGVLRSQNVNITDGVLHAINPTADAWFETSEIRPTSSSGWEDLTISGIFNDNNSIKALLLGCDDSVINIPSNVAPGQSASADGSWAIKSSELNAYSCIKIRFTLAGSSDTERVPPTITQVRVKWKPEAVYVARLIAPASVQAGQAINYRLNYSVSFVDGTGVVAYAPLPVASGYTAAYGQDLRVEFDRASNNGQYTDTAITVDGVDVPANSVYWRMGDVAAGSSGTVTYSLKTQNGWENGISYAARAVVTSVGMAATEGLATTKISSTPRPSVSKYATNIVYINSEDRKYVYQSSPYDGQVIYNIGYSNSSYPPIGVEALFGATMADDLSGIAELLTNTCGVADWTTKISGITGGGVLNAANKQISWTVGDLASGDYFSAQFVVDFMSCYGKVPAAGKDVVNTVAGMSTKTKAVNHNETVRVFGLPEYKVGYAKGENGSINVYEDDQYPSGDLTNMYGKVGYGNNTTFNLYARNEGINAARDTVMQDVVPVGMEYVSASLSAAAGGKIYYNTNASAAKFLWTNPTANGWTESQPANASSVKQVAFSIPCLQSQYGVIAASLCAEGARPYSVTGNITMRVLSSAYNLPVTDNLTRNQFGASPICSVTNIRNIGEFNTYHSGSGVTHFLTDDTEWAHGSVLMPELRNRTSVRGPSSIEAGQTANYTITIGNSSTSANTTSSTELRIVIPKVSVGAVLKSLEYGSLSGGTIDSVTTDANGNTVLVVKPGILAAGTSRTFDLPIIMPLGVMEGTNVQISVTLSATDINNCQQILVNAAQDTLLTGPAVLNLTKKVTQSLILPADYIDYTMDVNSIGGRISTQDTFVIDQIPAQAIFDKATCANCTVYFLSRTSALAATGIGVTSGTEASQIFANFSVGVQNGDVWMPPVSMPNSDVAYVAYLIGNGSGQSRVFIANERTSVGLRIKNDADGGGPNTVGSGQGVIVTNSAMTVSRESLLAVGNAVSTTIFERPGLVIDKTVSDDYVQASQKFEWYIDFYNDATENDVVATISDILPSGVKLDGIYGTWNQSAIDDGASPSGEFDLMSAEYQDSVDVSENNDGTTTVVVRIAAGLLTTLNPSQGGRLRIAVTADDDVVSGSSLINSAEGIFASDGHGPFSVFDDSVVEIHNPDLYLRKAVSNTNPRAGETVTYTLVFSNEGLTNAVGVNLVDSLPAGLCYGAGSIRVLTGGWELSEPTVAGGDCATSPTTLTWTGSQIRKTGGTDAVVPARSGNVVVTYNVVVDGSVLPGTTKQNTAVIGATSIEDDNFTNEASADLRTPVPDPYVNKTAASPSVLPGETFNYYISYGNKTNERAAGVYLIDELPDIDGADGRTDISILSVTGNNNETFWYYDANTASAPLVGKNISATYNFAEDTDFRSSFAGIDPEEFYPTHIIVVNTSIDNDGILDYYEHSGTITVEAQAINPYTGAELGQGSQWTNVASIYSSTLDDDMTNNGSSVDVAVPNADLAIEKTADVEGAFPGTTPGSAINYTVTYKNVGIGNVCGVRITDTLPSAIDSINSNFINISVVDNFGNATQLVNPAGMPIGSEISIAPTMVNDGNTITWYLGANSGSASDAAHYTQVCLPQGSSGSFVVSAMVKSDTVDDTEITNHVRVDEDIEDVTEDIVSNNEASTTTVAYRADLRLTKTAVSSGPDKALGTDDDSADVTNPGETIRYTLEYNNIGNATGVDAVINESIPSDVCFTVNSIDNVPQTATVAYSSDSGSTWDYQPVGLRDCNVTDFRISLGDMSAPANMVSNDVSFSAELGEVNYIIDDNEILKNKDITQISSGRSHTCAISGGKAYCWGSGTYGALGTGSSTSSLIPVAVDDSGALSGLVVKKIVAGAEYNTCVIAGDEGSSANDWIYCWGARHSVGEGNDIYYGPNSVTRPTAVDRGDVSVGVYFTDVSVGYSHICGVGSDKNAYCWGWGIEGQLGVDFYYPTTNDEETTFFVQREFGYDNLQDLLNDNYVTDMDEYIEYICDSWDGSPWSYNGCVYEEYVENEYGEGDWVYRYSYDMEDYMYALYYKSYTSDYDWSGSFTDYVENQYRFGSNVPLLVEDVGIASGLPVTKISAGVNSTCAIANGKAYCWGYGSYGQLGNGTSVYRQKTPVAISNGAMPSGVVITDISAGSGGTTSAVCAVAGGKAYCWGYNYYGQLGIGSTGGSRNVPNAVDVSGVLSGKTVTQISSGSSMVCALADGKNYCWGYNYYGQLGNGSTTNVASPVAVSSGGAPSDVDMTMISANNNNGCMIVAARAYCWGNNSSGQIGNGIVIAQNTPVLIGKTITDPLTVRPFAGAASISAGYNNTCFIGTDGQLYCWGTMSGSITPTVLPTVGVPDNAEITQVAFSTSNTSGTYTRLCLIADGEIYCRAASATAEFVRVNRGAIPASAAISKISVGNSVACAIADGLAYCWGSRNYGQLGDGFAALPADGGARLDMVAEYFGYDDLRDLLDSNDLGSIDEYFAEGYEHSYCYEYSYESHSNYNACTSMSDWLSAWGYSGNDALAGWLINRYYSSSVNPVAVDTSGVLSGKGIADITTGGNHTCAIADGWAYCWGYNDYGQLGVGTATGVSRRFFSPTQVVPGAVPGDAVYTNIVAVSNGSWNTTCAIASGRAYCWGEDGSGALGNGGVSGSQNVPNAVDVSGVLAGKTVTKIFGSYQTTCVIASGKVYCWGAGGSGQLGNGGTSSATSPVAVANGQIPFTDTITDISVSSNHACAIASNQTYCWGYNVSGQLGNGFYDQQTTPTAVVVARPMPSYASRAMVLSAPENASIKVYNDIYIDQRQGLYSFSDEDTPDGDGGAVNYYLKQMVGETCAVSNPDVPGFASPIFTAQANQRATTRISAAALDTNITDWCVVSEYADSGDVVSTVRISYSSPDDPYVAFSTVVSSNVQRNKISNIADIDTPTPEVTKANNSSQADLRVMQADLSLEKTADKTVLALTAAQAGNAQIIYDLTVKNLGPNDSAVPQIVDNLPSSMTFVSVEQISSDNGAGDESMVDFVCSNNQGTVTCNSSVPLLVGETAVLRVVATVNSDVSANATILNTACASAATVDIWSDNNCSQAMTSITTAPNIFTRKTGPEAANINKQFKYTITVGNSGNATAPNWQLTDTVNSNLTVVSASAVSVTGVSNINCSVAGQTVTCTTQNGDMPAGANATIEILVQVAGNQSLADNNTVIENMACATTSGNQTNSSDDCGKTSATIVPGDASIVTGRVFIDRNHNVQFNAGEDRGIANVTLTLSGVDSRGNAVNDTTTSDASGNYFFVGVRPGTYTVTQTQPGGYYDTGSTSGFFQTAPNGDPIFNPAKDGRGSEQDPDVSVNQIVNIVVSEGEIAQGNNFGEDAGGIGNIVWFDASRDGLHDANESGIAGVEVSVYDDVNVNGVYDADTDVLIDTRMTDALGYYNFDYVTLGDYIVRVTDINGVIAALRNSVAPAGHEAEDDWGKSAQGYAVTLTASNPANSVVDFGYLDIIDPKISISKTSDQADGEVKSGEAIAYTVTAINAVQHSDPAENLTVVDVLPVGLDYVDSTPAGVWDSTARTITWTISSLEYGADQSFVVNATANDDVAPGETITNHATISGVECVNDTSCEASNTNIVVPTDPIVAIVKTSNRDTVEAGDTVTYDLNIINTRVNSYPAEDVNVADVLPGFVDFVATTQPDGVAEGIYDPTTNEVYWTIPEVEYGSPVVLTVTVRIGDGVVDGDLIHNYAMHDYGGCIEGGEGCASSVDVMVVTPEAPGVPKTGEDAIFDRVVLASSGVGVTVVILAGGVILMRRMARRDR